MFEKILQKLKTQRGTTSNVTDRSLEDLAKSLVNIITTDEILETADLSGAITSIDGNIDHYTTKQVTKAKEDAIKEATKVTEKAKADKIKADAKKKAEESGQEPEVVPEWAKNMMEQNKTLADRLDTLNEDKTTSSRNALLKKSLENMPEYYSKPIMDAFANAKFEDDEKFETYLTGVKTNKEAFELAAKENGLNSFTPGKAQEVEETGETGEMAEARKIVAAANKKQKELQN